MTLYVDYMCTKSKEMLQYAVPVDACSMLAPY